MMDDDQDGGIEVEESVEVRNLLFMERFKRFFAVVKRPACVFFHARGRQTDRQGRAIQQQVSWLVAESNATSRIATV